MKRIYLLLIVIFTMFFLTTGCVKKDNMQNINIITSSYPTEFLVDSLYGDNSKVENIFPDGETIDEYEFNEKQYKMYSSKDLFVYNGSNASDIALELSNRNKELLLIDSTKGMKKIYGTEELWLDPSNMLMMAKNIKNGLEEYVTNKLLIEEIDKNYNKLKVSISELDASYKVSAENADYKTIVVGNESLKYLEKYNLNVIVLNDEALEKTYLEVRKLIANGTIKNIYIFNQHDINDNIQNLITNYKLKPVTLYRLDSITDLQRDSKKNYITIMNENLDLLKTELYK